MTGAIQTTECENGHLATIDESLPFPQRCDTCGGAVENPDVCADCGCCHCNCVGGCDGEHDCFAVACDCTRGLAR